MGRDDRPIGRLGLGVRQVLDAKRDGLGHGGDGAASAVDHPDASVGLGDLVRVEIMDELVERQLREFLPAPGGGDALV